MQGLLKRLDYDEEMQSRIITQAKKERAHEIKIRLQKEEEAKNKKVEEPP